MSRSVTASSQALYQVGEVPQLHLADFITKLRDTLPRLIFLLASDMVRGHEVWGQVLPYRVPAYGTGTSRGHCVRPDVLLTARGPKICELDFVASGRGYLLSGLTLAQQREVTQVFARWYRRMGVQHVLFATATKTICAEDAALFAQCMREQTTLDVRSGNIDTMQDADLRGVYVDRLFYRSEMAVDDARRCLVGHDVSTAEPYLDSKALFAFVHDMSATSMLREALGADRLAFLREVMPETRLVSTLKNDKERERIADARRDYVVKSTDVETDDSWGCRSTVIGATANKKPFFEALSGSHDLRGKHLGEHPIIQLFHKSRDFWQTWDAAVCGTVPLTRLVQRGVCEDIAIKQSATKEVGARIGFYFLIDRGTQSCLVTPYGDMVLRQDVYVHGASNAIALPVRAH